MSTEENETETETQNGNVKPDKVILVKHKHEGLPNTSNKGNKGETELERTKRELEEKTSQLSTIALREFEKEKAEILANIPDEDKRAKLEAEIVDPSQLEPLRISLGLEETEAEEEYRGGVGSGTGATIPPLPIKTGKKDSLLAPDVQYPDPMIQKLDDLYTIIHSDKSSEADKAKAQRTVDSLVNLALTTMSTTRPSKKQHWVVQTCPRCGKGVERDRRENFECPYCGFGKTKIGR